MFETTSGGESLVVRASFLQWFKAGFAFTCGAILATGIAWVIGLRILGLAMEAMVRGR
jgi:hypothetical protein